MNKQTVKKIKLAMSVKAKKEKRSVRTTMNSKKKTDRSSKYSDRKQKSACAEKSENAKKEGVDEIFSSCLKTTGRRKDLDKAADIIPKFAVTELLSTELSTEKEEDLTDRILRCDDIILLKQIVLETREQFLSELAAQNLTNSIKLEDMQNELYDYKSLANVYKQAAECKETGLKRIEEELTCRICHDIITKVHNLKFFLIESPQSN